MNKRAGSRLVSPARRLCMSHVLGEVRGAGTNSTVYSVRDDPKIVVKVIVFGTTTGMQDEEAFDDEVCALRRLGLHANVVRLLGMTHMLGVGGTLVFGACDGGTLGARLEATTPLARSTALRWAHDMFFALAYCHAQNIAHRDVKPANLLLSAADDTAARLVLADFGSAHIFADDAARLIGADWEYEVTTALYRAPELLFAQWHDRWDAETSPLRHSTPVDLWSAGCVLAELLDCAAGRYGGPIFDASTIHELAACIAGALGSPPAHMTRGVPHDFPKRAPPPVAWACRRGALGTDGVALLSATVAWDPATRLTAEAAAAHALFAPACDY